MAYTREPYEEIAIILDIAEYLPRLMADEENRDDDFRDQLVGLEKYGCGGALQRFDNPDLGRW